MKTVHLASVLALACMLCASPAIWAATSASLPKEHHRGDVRWMSGGVGKDQANAMRAIASRYNVRFVMAEARKPSAAFLASVPVMITDDTGRLVLRIETDGPFLFLHLPPGQYNVKAKVAGRTLSRSFTVKSKGARQLALVWPKPPGEH